MFQVLIDADNFIYKAGCIRKFDMTKQKSFGCFQLSPLARNEEPFDEIGYAFLPLSTCKEMIDTRISAIQQTCRKYFNKHKKFNFTLFISPDDGSNFRNFGNKYTVYKGNRKNGNPKQPLPFFLKELRQYLIDEYGAVVAKGREADDEVCILSYQKEDCVVCSNDKDVLYGFAGKKLNVDDLTFSEVTEDEAYFYFCCQMLMGDTADNIKGIKGIGPAKASKLISEGSEKYPFHPYSDACLRTVCEAYEKAYEGDYGDHGIPVAYEVFIENARLLWLLRSDNDAWYKHFNAAYLRDYYEKQA